MRRFGGPPARRPGARRRSGWRPSGRATADALWRLRISCADLVAADAVARRAWPRAFAAGRPRGDGCCSPCSAAAGPTLAAGLRAKGWDVDEVEAYRTVRRPAARPAVAEPPAGADAVVFASPSAVVGLPGGVRRRPGARCRCRLRWPASARPPRRRPGRPGWPWPSRRRRRPRRRAWWPRWWRTERRPRAAVRGRAPAVGWRVGFPERRLRRLRRTPALRRLVAETRLSVDDLVAPLFVREGIEEPRPDRARCPGRSSTPWPRWWPRPSGSSSLGVPGLILFGVPERKDAVGSGAFDPDGIVQVAPGRAPRGARRRAGAHRRPLPRRVHRPRALRRPRRQGDGRQRRHPRAVPAHGARPGGGRGRRRGARAG